MKPPNWVKLPEGTMEFHVGLMSAGLEELRRAVAWSLRSGTRSKTRRLKSRFNRVCGYPLYR